MANCNISRPLTPHLLVLIKHSHFNNFEICYLDKFIEKNIWERERERERENSIPARSMVYKVKHKSNKLYWPSKLNLYVFTPYFVPSDFFFCFFCFFFLIIVIFYKIKIPIGFWCRRIFKLISFIKLSEILLVELTGIHRKPLLCPKCRALNKKFVR